MNKLLLSLALIFSLLLTACAKPETNLETDSNESGDVAMKTMEPEPNPNETMTQTDFDQTANPEKGEQIVVIETNMGTMKLRLFPEIAPKTVENFTKLIEDGFYDGLIFHRVIPGFMIQGGDPKGDGTGGPGYTVPAEFSKKLSHIPGALSTARLGDMVNPEKASSGSQFFIVHGDATFLDNEYTIFGQLFDGMDVVDKIANAEKAPNDKPLEDVIMEKVTLSTFSG